MIANLTINLVILAATARAFPTNATFDPLFKRDGTFYSPIVMQSASNMVIDFPAPNGVPAPAHTHLQLYTYNGGTNQLFKFVPTNQYFDDNTYTIVHMGTGYCVDALSFGYHNRDPVGLFQCNGKENQVWSLKPYNGGYFIVSMLSNRCINNSAGNRVNGNDIILYDCEYTTTNLANIVWNINDAAIGKFFTQFKTLNNLVLDFPTPNDTPSPQGTQLQLWQNLGGPPQQFRFIQARDDPQYYYIVNQRTGMCVDVLNSAVTDGSPVGLLYWGKVENDFAYPYFYQAYLASRGFEMLGQYGVGAGSYQGSVQLPPPNGPPLPNTVNDLNAIGNYLHQLVAGGFLTPNPNTYYAVHFAPNTGYTCLNANNYCGEHTYWRISDIPNQSTDTLIYGLLPDLNGCDCGGSDVLFEDQTRTASHELIEAVTDPLLSGFRDPITHAEIGDLCNMMKFYIPVQASGVNVNVAVQKVWSNVANACVE
ncbi:hypothetical protein HDU76_013371 [Blyttiomyces sp. JEL0837]|nr:hypothetical protein HDU76_013371 [Blyttiomyces sp. JEL0837]